MSTVVKGWAFEEVVGFGVYNVDTVSKFVIPEDATPEQVKEFIRLLDPVLFKQEYGEDA